MARLDPTGVSRILSYIKNWVTAALGGKANSSHSHSDYIPKSGGGDLGSPFSRAVNTDELRFDGGTDWGHGASIAMLGMDHSSKAGFLILHSNDRNNGAEVVLTPNGGLIWNNGTTTKNIAMQEDVNALLNGKANSSHTHTKSQITDFPTIPTNTNQLTNGAGFITSSGSCNYANSAGSAGSATTAETVSTSVAAGSTKNLVYASMSNTDQCRIMCGGADNAGYMEIATSDDGNEPIYVRQYNNGAFGSIVRTLTLLDGSGNTQFPGTVTASTFSGNLNGSCSGTAGGVAWDNVSGKPSAFTPYFANNTWYAVGDDAAIGDHNVGGGLGVKALNSTTTRIDFCYKDDASNYKSITYDGTTLYMNGNCDYATSAGNSDTLDGIHEYSFLRYRGGTSTSGEGTLWAQIGIKGYYNALPDGLSGVYQWGEVVSLAGGNAKFDIYCSHMSSAGNGLYYRSGWDDDKKAWRRLIDDGNTGNISISGYQVYVG